MYEELDGKSGGKQDSRSRSDRGHVKYDAEERSHEW